MRKLKNDKTPIHKFFVEKTVIQSNIPQSERNDITERQLNKKIKATSTEIRNKGSHHELTKMEASKKGKLDDSRRLRLSDFRERNN